MGVMSVRMALATTAVVFQMDAGETALQQQDTRGAGTRRYQSIPAAGKRSAANPPHARAAID